ncbi:Glutathione transport system permease protein GsiC [subsurface metagenome]
MKEGKRSYNFLSYIIKRLLTIILVLFLISIAVFIMLSNAPGDPAVLMLGVTATMEQVEQLRDELGLNNPLYVQYWDFAKNFILNGSLGNSYRTGRPVIHEIAKALPISLSLSIVAIIISTVVAVFLGVLSAVKQYSLIDNLTKVIVLAGVSMPIFWLGLVLIVIFAVYLGILPSSGWGGSWKYVVLPAMTLATNPLAIICRLTRSTMLEVIRQDYITTCRAKGLPERLVIFRHALRNTSIPVFTLISLRLGGILTAAVLTETIFAIPGLGRLTITAVYARDYAMIRGSILTIALIFAIINLIVDLTYPLLDPRTKG